MQGPKDGGQQAAGNADKSPSGLITLSQADLDRIKADERAKIEGEVQAQLAELKKNGEEAHQIILSQGATLHRSNVRQIVLAMQGRGEHEFVKMPAGFSLPPAVVAKVEEYLSADVGANKGIKLSIGGESKDMSVSDICLAIVGAVIESKVGLVSLAPHGVTESEKPGGAQLSQDAVDKDIDAYLVKRNLVTVPASK